MRFKKECRMLSASRRKRHASGERSCAWQVLDLSGWKFLTESMTATVVEDQVGNRKDQRERARDKLSTVGTRTGSEAENSGRAGWDKQSPTVIKLNPVEPDGARGKNQH